MFLFPEHPKILKKSYGRRRNVDFNIEQRPKVAPKRDCGHDGRPLVGKPMEIKAKSKKKGHIRVWSKIGTLLNIKINITRPSISIFQIFLVLKKEEHVSFQAEKTRERSKLKKCSPQKSGVFF